jgi:hypothetical protein
MEKVKADGYRPLGTPGASGYGPVSVGLPEADKIAAIAAVFEAYVIGPAPARKAKRVPRNKMRGVRRG